MDPIVELIKEIKQNQCAIDILAYNRDDIMMILIGKKITIVMYFHFVFCIYQKMKAHFHHLLCDRESERI